uniref:Uncharacterized protein n=1 Tax=Romanomermis culicivorax TaxID=13658 RepID=A0A915L8S4_ROMCU
MGRVSYAEYQGHFEKTNAKSFWATLPLFIIFNSSQISRNIFISLADKGGSSASAPSRLSAVEVAVATTAASFDLSIISQSYSYFDQQNPTILPIFQTVEHDWDMLGNYPSDKIKLIRNNFLSGSDQVDPEVLLAFRAGGILNIYKHSIKNIDYSCERPKKGTNTIYIAPFEAHKLISES